MASEDRKRPVPKYEGDHGPQKQQVAVGTSKTKKMITLFTATALVVGLTAAALADEDEDDYCYDDNGDAYCDDDGRSVRSSAFIWVAGLSGSNTQVKKYERYGEPNAARTYVAPARPGTNVTSGNSSQPPSSASGSGTVVNQGSSSSSSSSSGITSGSKGGVGSSSSSSSSS